MLIHHLIWIRTGSGWLHSRDATIPFFQNRSDTENSEECPIPIQSDTRAVLFFYQSIIIFFFMNVEFLHFSVLT